ncbi:hypothetical protein BDK51DRAFT_49106 [Blyttiomyces helicus]|uniref:Uncharacterized protein n=1 Tax=Blyttiomyces helicus TaxID=388810 RepID=A0A4V1IPV7_9FUNG|nr:hypothetical protein BDK51DRAFT_49106 [Blyttiomyces helicus]|eukprot:RKO84397.1 hypothetical protein BDK51DRAFT_49106 [Blyttiomyces helicus]
MMNDVGPDARGGCGFTGAADQGNGAEIGAVAIIGSTVGQLLEDFLQELGGNDTICNLLPTPAHFVGVVKKLARSKASAPVGSTEDGGGRALNVLNVEGDLALRQELALGWLCRWPSDDGSQESVHKNSPAGYPLPDRGVNDFLGWPSKRTILRLYLIPTSRARPIGPHPPSGSPRAEFAFEVDCGFEDTLDPLKRQADNIREDHIAETRIENEFDRIAKETQTTTITPGQERWRRQGECGIEGGQAPPEPESFREKRGKKVFSRGTRQRNRRNGPAFYSYFKRGRATQALAPHRIRLYAGGGIHVLQAAYPIDGGVADRVGLDGINWVLDVSRFQPGALSSSR